MHETKGGRGGRYDFAREIPPATGTCDTFKQQINLATKQSNNHTTTKTCYVVCSYFSTIENAAGDRGAAKCRLSFSPFALFRKWMPPFEASWTNFNMSNRNNDSVRFVCGNWFFEHSWESFDRLRLLMSQNNLLCQRGSCAMFIGTTEFWYFIGNYNVNFRSVSKSLGFIV